MASARRIVVEFLGDDKSLGRTLDHAESKTSKFGSVLGKVGKAAAYGLGAGLVLAAGSAVKFGQAAADDQQSAALMAKTFENAAGATKQQIAATEDWISKTSLATGVADDEMRPALSKLVTATHDVGKAQRLMSLAMDVSAGSGKSLDSVSTALMKAQNGQVSALSRLGINTKNAAGETITMEQATRRMADTFGGAAAAKAATMQGSMDRLKVMFSETGEAIGYKLMPLMTSAMNFIQGTAVPAVEKFVHQMKSGKGAGGDFADVLGKVKAVLVTVGGVLVNVAKFANDHRRAVMLLVGAYAAFRLGLIAYRVQQAASLLILKAHTVGTIQNTIASKAAAAASKVWAAATYILGGAFRFALGPIGLIITAIGLLVAGFILAYKKSDTFRAIVDKTWAALKRFASFISGKVVSAFGAMSTAVGFVIDKVQDLWDKFQGFIDAVSNFHMPEFHFPDKPDWLPRMVAGGKDAGKEFGKAFKAAWVAVAFAVNPMVETLQAQLDTARDAIGALRDRRNELARTPIDYGAFRGFRGNLFGADITGAPDSEGAPTGPTGIAALLAFAKGQRSQAAGLANDVTTLVGKGLSQDLIDQLKSQGAQGIAQIHTLANASAQDIAQINADMAAADADNIRAGMAAGAQERADRAAELAAMDAQMTTMGTSVSQLAATLLAYVNAPTPIELHLHGVGPNGKTIVTRLLAYKRSIGNVDLGLG